MEGYVKAAVLDNEFEAHLMGSILEQRGVPHLITSYHDTAYNGLFQTQLGWGYVSAPLMHQHEIREILDALRKEASQVPASSGEPDADG